MTDKKWLKGFYFFNSMGGNFRSIILKYFFGVPHASTFIFVIFLNVYVIACIAYFHPVYGASVRTHNLLVMSHLP
jgi:hypothetical protein